MEHRTLSTLTVEGNGGPPVDFRTLEFDDRARMSRGRKNDTGNRRYAVVMAGGSGTRFWPWSRAATPKQLLPLAADSTMLVETVGRISELVPSRNVFVVTGERLRHAVIRDLPTVPRDQILCEPVGRNTAPCVAWAAMEIERRSPGAPMVVLPADHVVTPRTLFIGDLHLALDVAQRAERLVTFGIRPTHAETGYGYVRAGDALSREWPRDRVRRVVSFYEKPSAARARRFVRAGSYYWNSGMFAWRSDVILEELATYLPELSKRMKVLDVARVRGRIPNRVLATVYPRLPSISIDHGVMEKSQRAALIPARFQWNDIGSWDAVASVWPQDGAGNASRDPIVAIDSRDNVVATRGKPVALLGVSGLAVVDAGDAILVCARERAQEVRAVVGALSKSKLGHLQ
jgi:mannose-1-phosphate guanylyltransferase